MSSYFYILNSVLEWLPKAIHILKGGGTPPEAKSIMMVTH